MKLVLIEKQSKATLNRLTAEFEELRELPYVIGAANGSYISIITPFIDPISYYFGIFLFNSTSRCRGYQM